MAKPRISIQAARDAVLEHIGTLDAEQVSLDEALGRTLAGDAVAPDDVPPFASSAMDGFALIAADTQAAPARLQIVDEARAGHAAEQRVQPGGAVRISTGAPLPDGADAIVRQELTEVDGDTVLVGEPVSAGNDVRYAGEDIAKGDTTLLAGTLLGSPEIGHLASINIERPVVVRRPRVALVSTGDELVAPGPQLERGQVRDANSPALKAATRAAGGEVIASLRVGDDREQTVATIARALEGADVLCTVGGVSVGPHDHVRPALEQLGGREIFARVSLKPGGQVCCYVMPDERSTAGHPTLAFALPGNPASALTAFGMLVVPVLYALLGRAYEANATRGIAATDLPGALGRTTVVRCFAEMREDGWHVTPNGAQGSHILTSLLGVQALALVPEDRELLPAGERVEIEFVA